MQPEKYTEYEERFRRGKRLLEGGFGWLLLLSITFLYYLFSRDAFTSNLITFFENHWWQLSLFIVAMTLTLRIFLRESVLLVNLFEDFILESKIKETALDLKEMSKGSLSPYPSIGSFYLSSSLKRFEDEQIRCYNDLRSKLIKSKHIEHRETQLRYDIQRLERGSEERAKKISHALSLISSPKEYGRYQKRFNDAKTVEAVDLIIKEIHTKRKEVNEAEKRQLTKIEDLRTLLTYESSGGTSPRVKELVEEINRNPHNKEKIVLLKKAIWEQKHFNKQRIDETSDQEQCVE